MRKMSPRSIAFGYPMRTRQIFHASKSTGEIDAAAAVAVSPASGDRRTGDAQNATGMTNFVTCLPAKKERKRCDDVVLYIQHKWHHDASALSQKHFWPSRIQSFDSCLSLLRLFILIPGDFLIFVSGWRDGGGKVGSPLSPLDVHIGRQQGRTAAAADVNARDVCIKGDRDGERERQRWRT